MMPAAPIPAFDWIGASVMALFVNLAMAEFSAAYPTSGRAPPPPPISPNDTRSLVWYMVGLNFVGQIGDTVRHLVMPVATSSSRPRSPCSGPRM